MEFVEVASSTRASTELSDDVLAEASSHTYLTLDEGREGRRRLFPFRDGQVIYIPIFLFPHLILFPNATIPMTSQSSIEKVIMEEILGTRALEYLSPDRFNLSSSSLERGFFGVGLSTPDGIHKYGTVAEIYAQSTREEAPVSDLVHLVARGRKRFQMLEVLQFLSYRIGVATVRILPSGDDLPLPLEHQYSFIPKFVWKSYGGKTIVPLIVEQMKLKGFGDIVEKVPSYGSSSALSYWLSANLPFSTADKIKLLGFPSTYLRLKYILSWLSSLENETLVCISCHYPVCGASDIFSMSEEGVTAAYVNPQGYVHQIITVRKANNVVCHGEPTTEHSWFPGFSWEIVSCATCGAHIGWFFAAVSSACQPQEFWGIRREIIQSIVDA